MKTDDQTLADAIRKKARYLAHLWKITLNDGTVIGFTDYSENITYDSQIYSAANAFNAKTFESVAGRVARNTVAEVAIDGTTVEREGLIAGFWENAAIEVYQIDPTDTAAGALHIQSGYVGRISFDDLLAKIELRSPMTRLNQKFANRYSVACRAQFGSLQCGVNMSRFTVVGTIDDVTGPFSFSDNNRTEETDSFTGGTITFSTGDNAGISMMVRDHILDDLTGGNFTFFAPLPFTMALGDQYSLTYGCSKTHSRCQDFDTIKILTFSESGFTYPDKADIGTVVTGGTTGHTGILLGYDRQQETLTWRVSVDAATDVFDQAEAVSVPSGAGGTTTGAATDEPTGRKFRGFPYMPGDDVVRR